MVALLLALPILALLQYRWIGRLSCSEATLGRTSESVIAYGVFAAPDIILDVEAEKKNPERAAQIYANNASRVMAIRPGWGAPVFLRRFTTTERRLSYDVPQMCRHLKRPVGVVVGCTINKEEQIWAFERCGEGEGLGGGCARGGVFRAGGGWFHNVAKGCAPPNVLGVTGGYVLIYHADEFRYDRIAAQRLD